MYLEIKDYNALIAYEADLIRHPNRYNGLLGAVTVADKTDPKKRNLYKEQVRALAE